jgi:hypothetical protein
MDIAGTPMVRFFLGIGDHNLPLRRRKTLYYFKKQEISNEREPFPVIVRLIGQNSSFPSDW